jgi:formylglycine-generating enzyme required for sulfatase activity
MRFVLGILSASALIHFGLLDCVAPTRFLAECVAAEPANSSANGFSKTKPASGPAIEVEGGYLVPYQQTIPGSRVTFEMLPVPSGVVNLGSPDDSAGHADDEGPQVKVAVGAMWVGKCEISWAEYKLFMSMYALFKKFEQEKIRKVDASKMSLALTAPTELYEPTFTYEYGEELNMPAVTITQYAAKQYTKWLSGLTGLQYRLPTEAEWEYACRAGTTTAYSFGEDPAVIGDYAWFADNSDSKLHGVGSKKPNPWGLHDMHGSVMEWVIDGHLEDGYRALAGKPAPIPFTDAIIWPKELSNRVVRGGGWEDAPEKLRSAARLASDDASWKSTDPNIPKSPWWYTDDPARAVGFRVFRSYKPLEPELAKKFYDIDNEDIQLSVDIRLEEGRGVRGYSDPSLADEIKKAVAD